MHLGVGQFSAKKVGQFGAKTLGQFETKSVGQFERFFHCTLLCHVDHWLYSYAEPIAKYLDVFLWPATT